MNEQAAGAGGPLAFGPLAFLCGGLYGLPECVQLGAQFAHLLLKRCQSVTRGGLGAAGRRSPRGGGHDRGMDFAAEQMRIARVASARLAGQPHGRVHRRRSGRGGAGTPGSA